FVGGITCAACAWLIERHLAKLPGVAVTVNVSSHRCRVSWQPDQVKLSTILQAFEDIGYRARPLGDEAAEQQRSRGSKAWLLPMGLAGLRRMQAGAAALGLYFGAYTALDDESVAVLRWVIPVLTIPVVC